MTLFSSRRSAEPGAVTLSSTLPAGQFLSAFAMNSSRSAYNGRTRKIVLAFDVGTTFSGISYRYAGKLQIVSP